MRGAFVGCNGLLGRLPERLVERACAKGRVIAASDNERSDVSKVLVLLCCCEKHGRGLTILSLGTGD